MPKFVKDPLSVLRQFLATERKPLKMIKNVFLSCEKPFFSNVFTFLSWLFGFVEKRLDKNSKLNFKIYYVTDWTTNNFNTYISRSKGNQAMKIGQLVKYNVRNTFPQKSSRKWGRETSSRPLLLFLKKL